jgi:hypothetical protein
MVQRLGRFPCIGDELQLAAWTLHVEEVQGTLGARMCLQSRLHPAANK